MGVVEAHCGGGHLGRTAGAVSLLRGREGGGTAHGRMDAEPGAQQIEKRACADGHAGGRACLCGKHTNADNTGTILTVLHPMRSTIPLLMLA